MRWLKRMVLPVVDGWPTRPPPTVPPSGRPQFRCPRCRTAVADDATACPDCGAQLPTGG